MGPLQNVFGKIKISLKLSCQNKGQVSRLGFWNLFETEENFM